MSEEYFTAYRIALRLNEDAPRKSAKARSTQMIYNYITHGYITAKLVDDQKMISESEYQRFLKDYIARNASILA